jgi:hypothetical protein
MVKDYNQRLELAEDDPGDAVWSKIEKRKNQRAAAKERRRTGKLNKGQRKEKRHEAVRATGRYSEKYATFEEKMNAKDLRRENRKKHLNLKDMLVPIDKVTKNDAGDLTIEIPKECDAEEVLAEMKEHFASKHPGGTVKETRNEEGNVTGLHWAKDEAETETLLTILNEEVTVEVQAATEEMPLEIANLEENLEPRRKSRVVERGYERNYKLVGLTKRRANYRCEVKGCVVELFVKPDGYRYVEVHHLIMMAKGGPDTLENMVCLCPNHHRELHYGQHKEELKIQLQILRAV